MTAKHILITLGVTVLVIIGAVVALLTWTAAPENIVIKIEHPASVKINTPFELVVRVQNTGTESQTLSSIDIGESYIEGINILKTVPVYKNASHVPIENTLSYEFEKSIPAGEELVVRFEVNAVKVGDFRGALDVCVNGVAKCIFDQVRTIVE